MGHYYEEPIITKICPVCGKEFPPAPWHRYKAVIGGNKVLVCTYPCMMKADKEHEEKKRRNQEARAARMKKKKSATDTAQK